MIAEKHRAPSVAGMDGYPMCGDVVNRHLEQSTSCPCTVTVPHDMNNRKKPYYFLDIVLLHFLGLSLEGDLLELYYI